MDRILVTGSNGLLGQKLTSLICSEERAELIATSKGDNRYPDQGNFIYAGMDITSHEEITKVLDLYHPDVIIHTAAMTNADVCEEKKQLCQALNTNAVAALCSECEARKIHLVHLSTDFVFDGENGPYSEEDKPNPISYYGKSKADAENIILASSCSSAIIRTILVYGVTPQMSRSNIVLWAKAALEKGMPINVVTDQWRMPTLAEDLAEACLLIAEKRASGIFHISGSEMMSVFELATRVAAFWNLDSSLILPVVSASLNQVARRPRTTGFVLEKAERILNYHPHSFEDGLELLDRQLQYYRLA